MVIDHNVATAVKKIILKIMLKLMACQVQAKALIRITQSVNNLLLQICLL